MAVQLWSRASSDAPGTMEFTIGCPKSRLVWGIPCSPDVDCLVDAFGWLMAEVMDNHAFRANLPSQLTPFMKMAISRFEEMDLELEQTGLELRLFPVVLPVKAEEEPKADASVIEPKTDASVIEPKDRHECDRAGC